VCDWDREVMWSDVLEVREIGTFHVVHGQFECTDIAMSPSCRYTVVFLLSSFPGGRTYLFSIMTPSYRFMLYVLIILGI
jgi:hypothetical protein